MTALQLQAEIQELLRKEENINVLEAIRMLLRRVKTTTSPMKRWQSWIPCATSGSKAQRSS